MTTIAVDYSYSRPDLDTLKSRGITNVIRYISRDPHKCITRDEAQTLHRKGFRVGLVFEDAAANPLGGKGQGYADATFAKDVCRTIGYTAPYIVHWAMDYDPSPYGFHASDQYAAEFRTTFGADNTGPYGGLTAIEHYADLGYKRLWQTLAWSHVGGRLVWSPKATMRQYANGISIAGGEVDFDLVFADEFDIAHTRPEIGGLTPAEWAQLEAFRNTHYARYLWGHVWHDWTTNPAKAEAIYRREILGIKE